MGVKKSLTKQLVLASTLLMAYYSTHASANLSSALTSDDKVQDQRIPTEELIEGIKSADGRWFDVEIIIFERTRESATRERFEQTITNKKPRYGWDVQADLLKPDIAPLLYNLPNCHSDSDPLAVPIDNQTDDHAEFYQRYNQYQRLISEQWQISPNLCLLPSEKLSFFWQLMTAPQFLPSSQQLYTFVPFEYFPKRPTGRDFDDYRGVYLLSEQNLELKEQADRLDKNWSTRVLLHMGWRQPGLSPNNAIKMYLRAGKNFTEQFNYDGSAKLDTDLLATQLNLSDQQQDPNNTFANNDTDPKSLLRASNQEAIHRLLSQLEAGAIIDPKTQTLKMPNEQYFPNDVWQLDGTIKVILDHYLFLDADFNFREVAKKPLDIEQLIGNQTENQATSATNVLTSNGQSVLISAAQKDNQVSEFNEFKDDQNDSSNPASLLEVEYLQNFPFKQLRRTYSGDLHYLDHPKFGVLFQIRKYRH
ncbi:hypothetical protein J1N51_01305 [Psychrosphaera ytuae]|uniref:Uncharacterized protein n=1 Tax=Psychrosphaera ytuae TaxID=2820710 RepID=A0A975HKB7_9GAMM|nr:CsiV family protein [Psychrosphaera ytuae]QTH64154.1 hypothetical protein J1N51_01305 [Psychrosphaera ytuae]